jgi:hypothetical protein
MDVPSIIPRQSIAIEHDRGLHCILSSLSQFKCNEERPKIMDVTKQFQTAIQISEDLPRVMWAMSEEALVSVWAGRGNDIIQSVRESLAVLDDPDFNPSSDEARSILPVLVAATRGTNSGRECVNALIGSKVDDYISGESYPEDVEQAENIFKKLKPIAEDTINALERRLEIVPAQPDIQPN